MANKYKSVQKTVEAIQFTFDTLKDIYLWLDYRDVSYYVKSRVLSGTVTGKDNTKYGVAKEDYIVKSSDGTIQVMKPDVFKKEYIKAE